MNPSTALTKLRNKYRNIAQHIRYQGFTVFFISKTYDHYQKFRLKKMGIYHPPRNGDMISTNARSINKDCHENQPSSFYDLREGFKRSGLKNNEIALIDIGCGDGRVLNFGMLLHFKQVIGIDLDEAAVKKATENCKKMQQHDFKTSFHLQHADASSFAIPENINLVYLFNPFGQKTMETVVDNIISSAAMRQSEIYVIYCVPDCIGIFSNKEACTKIYERQNKDKTDVYMSVFRIAPKNNAGRVAV